MPINLMVSQLACSSGIKCHKVEFKDIGSQILWILRLQWFDTFYLASIIINISLLLNNLSLILS